MSSNDPKRPEAPTRYPPRAGTAGSDRPASQSQPQSQTPSRYARAPEAPPTQAPTASTPRYAHHRSDSNVGSGSNDGSANRTPSTRYSQASQRPQGSQRYQSAQAPRAGGSARQPTHKYRQPPVNHKVNNPTAGAEVMTFFKIIAKLFIGIILLLTIVHFALRLLIPYTPYSVEEKLGDLVASVMAPASTGDAEMSAYLQKLAEDLAAKMDVPSDMPIHVYYIKDKMPNAFATLGGHIFITQGLLDVVNSENALAMVLAHELGHVKNRDPLTSLGSGIVFAVVMMVIGSDSETVMDVIGGFTNLSFSRAQESKADEEAIIAISGHYGHTLGGEEFFEAILELIKNETSLSRKEPNEFFSTHPNTQGRLERIRATQSSANQVLTPFPQFMSEYKKAPLSDIEKAAQRLDKLNKKEERRKRSDKK